MQHNILLLSSQIAPTKSLHSFADIALGSSPLVTPNKRDSEQMIKPEFKTENFPNVPMVLPNMAKSKQSLILTSDLPIYDRLSLKYTESSDDNKKLKNQNPTLIVSGNQKRNTEPETETGKQRRETAKENPNSECSFVATKVDVPCKSNMEVEMQLQMAKRTGVESEIDVVGILREFEIRNEGTLYCVQRKNCWTFSEEVMLVGTVCEQFLRRGSLACSRSKDTDNCWQEIADDYEIARKILARHLSYQLGKQREGQIELAKPKGDRDYFEPSLKDLKDIQLLHELEELKERNDKALSRHFKVMKSKYRLDLASFQQQARKLKEVNNGRNEFDDTNLVFASGLHVFFEAWLATFGRLAFSSDVLKPTLGLKFLENKEDSAVFSCKHEHSEQVSDTRTNAWSFFEGVALVGAIMQRLLYFGSLVKNEKDCWSGIKYMFDLSYSRFVNEYNSGRIVASCETKFGEDETTQDLINKELMKLSTEITVVDRSASAIQRHYKVMRSFSKEASSPCKCGAKRRTKERTLKTYYLAWCSLSRTIAGLNKDSSASSSALFAERDFLKMVNAFYEVDIPEHNLLINCRGQGLKRKRSETSVQSSFSSDQSIPSDTMLSHEDIKKELQSVDNAKQAIDDVVTNNRTHEKRQKLNKNLSNNDVVTSPQSSIETLPHVHNVQAQYLQQLITSLQEQQQQKNFQQQILNLNQFSQMHWMNPFLMQSPESLYFQQLQSLQQPQLNFTTALELFNNNLLLQQLQMQVAFNSATNMNNAGLTIPNGDNQPKQFSFPLKQLHSSKSSS